MHTVFTVLFHNPTFPFSRMSSEVTHRISSTLTISYVYTVCLDHIHNQFSPPSIPRYPLTYPLYHYVPPFHNPLSPIRACLSERWPILSASSCAGDCSHSNFMSDQPRNAQKTATLLPTLHLLQSLGPLFLQCSLNLGRHWHICLIRDECLMVTFVTVGWLWACSNCQPLRDKRLVKTEGSAN